MEVGTSGNRLERVGLSTAMARSVPACRLPSAGGSTPKAIFTCPPSRSFITCPVPLYGMMVASVPVIDLNSSAER